MFGFIARSKSTASLLSVAVLASAMLAPAALAAPFSAGNSFEIPIVPHDRMDRAYSIEPQHLWGGNADEIPLVTQGGMRAATHVATKARARQATTVPADASYSNSNTECVGGYTWSPTPNSGATLPMRCHG